MPDAHHDVLIIGGGLAGLFVARSLEGHGVDWGLLEARPALGGRIRSGPAGADIGPMWFWPHQRRMTALTAALGLEVFEQPADGDVVLEFDRDSALLRRPSPQDAARSLRLAGGISALIGRLAETLPRDRLMLDQPVVAVRRTDHQPALWKASTPVGVHTADRLIFALPPRLIARDLSPGDWASRDLARDLADQQTWMAGQAKYVAIYPSRFWSDRGLSGQAMSAAGPMGEVHDASPHPLGRPGPAALFGFLGLPARHRAALERDELLAACRTQLGRLFGPEATAPTEEALQDWAGDRWTATPTDAGEPSRHAAFPMHRHRDELAALSLGLAGSEFAASEPGYLEGALEAAEDALAAGAPDARESGT